MRDQKCLAAEVEAVTERERTRLIAWLAEHQVSTASTIDREMTADALMADFVAPLLAQLHSSRTSEEIADIMAEVGFRRMVEVGDERDALKSEVVALQSRAFEDGARWMKAEAVIKAAGWIIKAPPGITLTLTERLQERNYTAENILKEIVEVALPLQPEGERNA